MNLRMYCLSKSKHTTHHSGVASSAALNETHDVTKYPVHTMSIQTATLNMQKQTYHHNQQNYLQVRKIE